MNNIVIWARKITKSQQHVFNRDFLISFFKISASQEDREDTITLLIYHLQHQHRGLAKKQGGVLQIFERPVIFFEPIKRCKMGQNIFIK